MFIRTAPQLPLDIYCCKTFEKIRTYGHSFIFTVEYMWRCSVLQRYDFKGFKQNHAKLFYLTKSLHIFKIVYARWLMSCIY